VVCPAGPVPADRLHAGLAVVGARYRVKVADDVLRADGYLAGSDARRAEELMAAIADPDVRAVLVARGGYGLLRILPHLDPTLLARDPKPIVGFSDVTSLLSWAERAGVRGIHGPVVAQLGDLPASDHAALFELLERPTPIGILGGLAPIGAPAAPATPIAGYLRGGNLTLVAHLVGTPWAVDPAEAILLLEEVGERPYAIDRYLTRLDLAGGLAGVRGALVGDLTRCEERIIGGSPDARAVVHERLAAFGISGLAGLPLGHGPRNRALPWGARVTLDPVAGVLDIHDAAVG
jgi:muramoyltetrapeptide carboxypeptidase